jgi:conjugal transfer/entry exclusion protein
MTLYYKVIKNNIKQYKNNIKQYKNILSILLYLINGFIDEWFNE